MDHYNTLIGKILANINGFDRYAITLGQHTYYSCSKEQVPLWWHLHEDAHKLQFQRDGWYKFLTRYIWQGITKGYENIDYEVEARAIADKFR